jgi:hypothetical protein
MAIVKINSKRDLHFAAYIKVHGAKLIGYESPYFIFESDEREEEMRIKHVNSTELAVDQTLLKLKGLLKN